MARKIAVKKPTYGVKRDPVAECKKPSELIRLAINDLDKVEADAAKYKIDMGVWHRRRAGNKKCVVCFAGAVMAMSYVKDPVVDVDPWDQNAFSPVTSMRLSGLNDVRAGHVRGFIKQFYFYTNAAKLRAADKKLDAAFPRPASSWENDVKITHYFPHTKKQRSLFRGEMIAVATKLESVGL